MIEQIRNFSNKTYKDYTGPENPNSYFTRINVFYGNNGAGKSTLALGIKDELLKDNNKSEENYRLFNRNYIKEHLLITGSESKIKGVKISFGKKDIDIDNSIRNLKTQILNTEQIETEINEIENDVKAILESYKKSYLPKRLRMPSYDFEKFYIDFNSVKEAGLKLKDENFIREYNYGKANSDLEELENISYEIDDKDYFDYLINVNSISIKKYNTDKIPTIKVIEWLKNGIELHENDDSGKCMFCGSNFDILDVSKRLNIYLENERQKDSIKISEYKRFLISNIEMIDHILNNKKQLSVLLKLDNSLLSDLNDHKEMLNKELECVNTKLNNFDNAIPLADVLIREAIINSRRIMLAIKNKLQNEIERFGELANKENILIKAKLAIAIIDDNNIKKKLKDRETKIENIKSIGEKNNQLKQTIKQLEEQKSDISSFAEYLNRVLKILELKFQLKIEDNAYLLEHTDKNIELTINDISEGELNLLALMFFYYELYDDIEKLKLKDDIELVVVDDPISSVDRYNRFFIISLIDNMYEAIKNSKNRSKQLFLFTHVWEDFCELTYGKINKNMDFNAYTIFKESSQSRIEKIKKTESIYKHSFKEIYNLSKNKVIDNDNDLYHLPNTMRRVLEEYLKFNSPNSNPTSKNFENICNVLCGNNPEEYEKTKLRQFLSVCNTYSHELYKSDEVLSSAKFFIECIRKNDPNHYSAMISE